MVDSPVAAPERDVLLATKLHLPGPRPDLVPRPRLTARLDEGLARGLVLVCAPAGYGKTVLLADWARRGRHPVGWLSMDAGDNDPARFWRHVVAALDRARPGTGERMAPLLGPPAPSSFQGLVTALINDLAGEEEAQLVLDDYHVIGSPQVHESLAAQRAGRAAAGVPLGYLARLQRAFGTGRPGPDPVPAGLVDPLTSRELEVLEMLAAGRSNQAIAYELVVTLDTVKKHVGHVMGKLGAANRTEAVARARELSLIP